MSPLKFICFFVCFCIPVEQLHAQYPFSKKMDIEEENLILKANVLLRDHQGVLWIGSSVGLFKYNASIPEKISNGKKEKLNITTLLEDTEGTIWAGCKDGRIVKVENNKISFFKPEEKLPGVSITAIYQDAKKRLWFATGGEGLYCYDQVHVVNITEKDGLGADFVNCLYSPNGSDIIAGTDHGLSFLTYENGNKKIQIFTTKNGLPDNIVSCITKSKSPNRIWVGTQSKGFLLFSLDKKQIVDAGIKNSLWLYGQINDLIEVNHSIFIATEENGIIGFDSKTGYLNKSVLRDTLFPKRVSDLQPDNEGNIWAASENKLISFTGDYLHYWVAAKEVKFLKVHSLYADDDNKLWFTPDFRLFESSADHFCKDNLHSYDITAPLNHIDITCFYKDRFGYLWIGTMGEGLFRMNVETRKWRRITENPIAYFGNILSIAGKDDQVWISTLNGVSRFSLTEENYELNSKISFTNYNKKDGLGSDYIYHMLIDKKNRVWFATDGAGVTVFENNAFVNFYSTGQFPSSVAYSLTEDNNQHIWISTYNKGLFEYDGTKFIQYGTKNGLTDLAISSISVDAYNNIIAINKKGIDVLNPALNIVQHFGAESGFSELQPNLNSITKAQDGKIWIGTENGIVCLNTQPSFSNFLPVAVIEYVNLFNKPIDTTVRNIFTYDQNNFSFKLAAAYYKAPEKIQFQYWLEGYSKNWETTKDRFINFPQLPHGKYCMKVRASANDNFESSPIAFYNFTITQSFWTTWWFRIVILLSFSGFIYWFVKQRIQIVKKTEHAEREKFQLQYEALKNQVNPHFLFNSFNALMNIVEDDPKEAAALIKHLSQFYRKMTAYSQKELITLDEELELLNSYLFIQKKRFGTALQVNIDIEPALKKSTFIPPLVLQLLAENAVKHNTISKDKPLHITIFSEGDLIVMQNNFNPKLEKEESEGVGLQNIKNRYKFLLNKKVIQEENNEAFIVKLPLIYSN